MTMNLKTKAHIHSLEGKLDDVEIIEKCGDNDFVALYKGKRYSAIFNPFAWDYPYYVDDIYGLINQ